MLRDSWAATIAARRSGFIYCSLSEFMHGWQCYLRAGYSTPMVSSTLAQIQASRPDSFPSMSLPGGDLELRCLARPDREAQAKKGERRDERQESRRRGEGRDEGQDEGRDERQGEGQGHQRGKGAKGGEGRDEGQYEGQDERQGEGQGHQRGKGAKAGGDRSWARRALRASVARASRQAAAKALKEIRQDEEHRSSSGTRGGTAPGPVDLDPEFEGMRQDLDGASAGSGMPLGAALSEALGLGNPDGSHTYSWGNQEFVWRDGREFRLSFEKCEDIQAEKDLDGASAGSGMPLGAALSEALGLGNPDGSHTYSWGNQEFVWRDGREFRLSFEKCEDIQAETPTPSSVKTRVKRVKTDVYSNELATPTTEDEDALPDLRNSPTERQQKRARCAVFAAVRKSASLQAGFPAIPQSWRSPDKSSHGPSHSDGVRPVATQPTPLRRVSTNPRVFASLRASSSSGTRGGTAPGPVDLDPEFEGMRQDLDDALSSRACVGPHGLEPLSLSHSPTWCINCGAPGEPGLCSSCAGLNAAGHRLTLQYATVAAGPWAAREDGGDLEPLLPELPPICMDCDLPLGQPAGEDTQVMVCECVRSHIDLADLDGSVRCYEPREVHEQQAAKRARIDLADLDGSVQCYEPREVPHELSAAHAPPSLPAPASPPGPVVDYQHMSEEDVVRHLLGRDPTGPFLLSAPSGIGGIGGIGGPSLATRARIDQ